MSKLPKVLYYRCQHPVEILAERRIRCSEIYGGVSFSANKKLTSHGSRQLAFKQCAWFDQLIPVLYIKAKHGEKIPGRLVIPVLFWYDQHGKHYTEEQQEAIMQKNSGTVGLPGITVFKTNADFMNEQEWVSQTDIFFSKEDLLWAKV